MNNECQWSLPVFQTNLEKTSPVAGFYTVNKTGLQTIFKTLFFWGEGGIGGVACKSHLVPRLPSRQTDGQTGKQTDRQTDGQDWQELLL